VQGALAAGTGFIMFSGMVGACGIALRSSLPAIAEVQDGPSAIFAIMVGGLLVYRLLCCIQFRVCPSTTPRQRRLVWRLNALRTSLTCIK
jgi:hypothetical protein